MRRMIGYGTASPERAGQPPAPLRSPDAADHASIRDYLPALALGIGSLSALIYITFFSIAPDSPVAVVFPLSYSRFDAWNAALDAGGLVIREEFGGGVLIIQPQDAAFQQRIRDAGALFLMNPVLVGVSIPYRWPRLQIVRRRTLA